MLADGAEGQGGRETCVGGSRGRAVVSLNRRRALTFPMIRALSRLLDLPAEVRVPGV